MKSPTLKIQSPDSDVFIKVEPLVNPEPHSVPSLSSAVLVAGLAVPKSAQPLAPGVQDATSVAASLHAWEGDPAASASPSTSLPSSLLYVPAPTDFPQVIGLDPLPPSSSHESDYSPAFDPPFSPLAPVNLVGAPPLPPRGGEVGIPAFRAPFEEQPQLQPIHHAAYPNRTRVVDIPASNFHEKISI